MDKDLLNYQKKIKKTISFKYKPSYTQTFNTELAPRTGLEIASLAFEKLEWGIVYQDDKSIEAKRVLDFGSETEKIIVAFNDNGSVVVTSNSLRSRLCDFGSNSKRVKLFIYAFERELESFDEAKLQALENEIQRKDNWADYEIPDTLPTLQEDLTPNPPILMVGAVAIALILGALVSMVFSTGMYIIGLVEFVVGLIFSVVIFALVKLSKYNDLDKLKILSIASIVLIYVSSIYFRYLFIKMDHPEANFSFIEYFKVLFENGFQYKELNLGSIGLLVFWGLQFYLTYIISYFRIINKVIDYNIKRVPEEVIEFTIYLFNQDKTETEIKTELYKKGWKKDEEFELVMQAIGSIQTVNEIVRDE
jgi:hypothetical protein